MFTDHICSAVIRKKISLPASNFNLISGFPFFMRSMLLSFTLIFGIPFLSYGQLDSIDVQTSLIHIEDADSTLSGDAFEIGIWVNDLDSLGDVVVDILIATAESEIPMYQYTYTRSEILSQQLYVDDRIIIRSALVNSNGSYIIKTNVRNHHFFYLQEAITLYP